MSPPGSCPTNTAGAPEAVSQPGVPSRRDVRPPEEKVNQRAEGAGVRGSEAASVPGRQGDVWKSNMSPEMGSWGTDVPWGRGELGVPRRVESGSTGAPEV